MGRLFFCVAFAFVLSSFSVADGFRLKPERAKSKADSDFSQDGIAHIGCISEGGKCNGASHCKRNCCYGKWRYPWNIKQAYCCYHCPQLRQEGEDINTDDESDAFVEEGGENFEDPDEDEQEYTDADIAREFAEVSAKDMQAVTPLASWTVLAQGVKQVCREKLKGGCTCGTSVSKLTDLAKSSCSNTANCKFVSVWPRDDSQGGGSCFRYSSNCNSMGPLTSSSKTATIWKKSR
jgi:hypothetical protein